MTWSRKVDEWSKWSAFGSLEEEGERCTRVKECCEHNCCASNSLPALGGPIRRINMTSRRGVGEREAKRRGFQVVLLPYQLFSNDFAVKPTRTCIRLVTDFQVRPAVPTTGHIATRLGQLARRLSRAALAEQSILAAAQDLPLENNPNIHFLLLLPTRPSSFTSRTEMASTQLGPSSSLFRRVQARAAPGSYST